MASFKRFAERIARQFTLSDLDPPLAAGSTDRDNPTSSGASPSRKRSLRLPRTPGSTRSTTNKSARNGTAGPGSGTPGSVKYVQKDRSALSSPLLSLFEQEILVDLQVAVQDCVIPAHKAVLASQSPVLRELIKKAEQDQQHGLKKFESMSFDFDDEAKITTIDLNWISSDIAYIIIRFMYSGNALLSDANVIDIFLASNQLKMEELKRKCEDHVSTAISCDSLNLLLQAARHHNAKELEKRCINFFQRNAEVVLKSESLLEIPENLLLSLLCRDFYVSDELFVFDFVMNWGRTQRRLLASGNNLNNKENLPSLAEIVARVMKYVRLISIPKDHLESKVYDAEVVDDDLILEVLFRKLQTGILPPTTTIPSQLADDPDACDPVSGKPLKFFLVPRRGFWKKLNDFPSEAEYAVYLKSVLRPGMLVRAVNAYEQVTQGDVGEFVQYNTGIPPCQVRWQIYGNTYWLFWRDLEIIS